MKVKLGIGTLFELDGGKVVKAFDLALKRLIGDCIDRPGDDRPRVVNLKGRLTPVAEEDGSCERAHLEFEITDSVPNRRSRRFEVNVKPSGVALINPESPDDVAQGTLDEVAGAKNKAEE